MEAGDCPTLNMNAKENYLLSQSLISTRCVCGLCQTDGSNLNCILEAAVFTASESDVVMMLILTRTKVTKAQNLPIANFSQINKKKMTNLMCCTENITFFLWSLACLQCTI